MMEKNKNFEPLNGLIAATFTPFDQNGKLNLDPIPRIVEHHAKCSINALFINGTTGEGPSLTEQERIIVAESYAKEAKSHGIKSIIHVGHESLLAAGSFAAHAAEIGADCISAVPTSYFKPSSLNGLIDHLSAITSHAPDIPFYYYHIPRMNSVQFDMLELLQAAEKDLPSLVGIKYSASELSTFVECKKYKDGKYNMLYGSDEMLLAGLAMGADGAVGSTYNFLAPLYNKVISEFEANNKQSAQIHQAKSAELIRAIISTAGFPGLKVAMAIAGFDCGPHRLPLKTPSPGIVDELRNRLESAGFLEWNVPQGE
ncbi:MAG: dihydrodipicolinate synthase family protein [Verrucomicrobiota bacterium]|nr:dihydrodipicolinate synthase family protein [Verrucomicrobiota bacterium]MED5470461.1 dihydrodipicolinate synthase family protein [Verrucomicrobiota bacterium]